MEYFIIALIAMMWGWREFVKSMRLNTIEQELEGIGRGEIGRAHV